MQLFVFLRLKDLYFPDYFRTGRRRRKAVLTGASILLLNVAPGLFSLYAIVPPHVFNLLLVFPIYPWFIVTLICFVLFPYFLVTSALELMANLVKRSLDFVRELRSPRPARPVETADRRAFLKVLTAGIAMPVVGCSVYGSYVGRERLIIERHEIAFPALPEDLSGLTITQISDIHMGPFMSPKRLEEIVRVTNELRSHVVVITGDIINWGNKAMYLALGPLSDIEAPLGVFAILGNHDFYGDTDRMVKEFDRKGIHFLRDTWVTLGRSSSRFCLIGLDDPRGGWVYNSRFTTFKDTIDAVPEEGFKVLLCHRPNIFDLAAESGVDLTLSGHTHGGQVAMPSLLTKGPSLASLFYRYDRGLFHKRGRYLYVNRGVGVVGAPVRINCPQEITQITLRKERLETARS